MAEESFEALDEAAVAGAHGLGWGPAPLLSPVDILNIDELHRFADIDVFLKPTMQAPVDPAALRDALTGTIARPVPVAPAPQAQVVSMEAHIIPFVDVKPQQRARGKPGSPPRRRGAVRKKGAARKQTRANEVLEYGSLADIAGTTAARSRQMNEEERRVMLHKRRLRNRASAARSREKRCRTITELGKEIAGLLERTSKVTEECTEVKKENEAVTMENDVLKEDNFALKEKLERVLAEKETLEKENHLLREMK